MLMKTRVEVNTKLLRSQGTQYCKAHFKGYLRVFYIEYLFDTLTAKGNLKIPLVICENILLELIIK